MTHLFSAASQALERTIRMNTANIQDPTNFGWTNSNNKFHVHKTTVKYMIIELLSTTVQTIGCRHNTEIAFMSGCLLEHSGSVMSRK